YYNRLPAIVEEYMGKVNAKLGTDYQLFNYYGAADAENIIIAMGSICDVAEEVIDYLTAKGEKVGLVKVRLYRPFVAEKLAAAIPATVKNIAVLDRTKEPGALGEPLFLDVVAALNEVGREGIRVIGGRYGLGSKDTPPSSVFAVYDELKKDAPKKHFTLGINDDVTYLSLEEKPAPNTAAEGTIECKFWGLGGDGTVGANKNSIKIIGDYTNKYVQAYFQYDSKKTGGITISHLRFGDKPIKSPYYINKADFVACHNPSYVEKGYKMVNDVKPGGVFLINCQWDEAELFEKLNAETKRYIAKNNVQLYTINAIDLAASIGMGKRTNTTLQAAFFALAKVMPIEEAVQHMKDAATKSYLKKGQDIVDMNHKAIDLGVNAYKKVEVPAEWVNAVDAPVEHQLDGPDKLVDQVKKILFPVDLMDGDSLPVSSFTDGHEDGTFELGAAAYEKRGVAVMVPEWNAATCAQCNQCAFVCPHATIRPFALNEAEVAAAPENMKKGPRPVLRTPYVYTLAVSPMDCMGCGVCVGVCPTKSLKMVPRETQDAEQVVFDYCVAQVAEKPEVATSANLITSQFKKPLLEFSGSCAGCAETSYARLITQLFGDRMYISNATGCSSIWGGPAATSPYTVNAEGHGPTWANSLFEDNAEHGFGMYLGQNAIRSRLIAEIEAHCNEDCADEFKTLAKEFLETAEDGAKNQAPAKALAEFAEKNADKCDVCKDIANNREYLSKKSVWIFGGDGWAYDIGFGGLDHVLASGEDVNIMVFDTEVYSNTGGQASKASQIGQVAQFAAAGKAIKKKSLSEIAMSYGYVYVAQVAMGANMNQTLNALKEAEAYHGPSLVIGYAPCEMHSIKGGMVNCQTEMKKAVDCGYWNMFRYNPALKEQGKNPFTLDSKEPTTDYKEFILNEARYSSLTRSFPERAEKLFAKAAAEAVKRYKHLCELREMYGREVEA
ncbi:MAG: pyruvate:ferredoxin (flavodoxin) oxidoreductase, partial [Lachnospiraceae bacterium]|nr:pyruvate:ferredoxin (flavodoxin) oxidoreductase [Lachnospiraceae bacterium]